MYWSFSLKEIPNEEPENKFCLMKTGSQVTFFVGIKICPTTGNIIWPMGRENENKNEMTQWDYFFHFECEGSPIHVDVGLMKWILRESQGFTYIFWRGCLKLNEVENVF